MNHLDPPHEDRSRSSCAAHCWPSGSRPAGRRAAASERRAKPGPEPWSKVASSTTPHDFSHEPRCFPGRPCSR